MDEKPENQPGGVVDINQSLLDLNNPEMVFDNLTILKELSNIVNLVRNEDFLDTVPKSKLKRVKWVPIFNYLKQLIHNKMVQELSSMWRFENMSQMLEILQKQKEKFNERGIENKLWRPQLGDVKSQLRAHDFVNLQKQKVLLEALAKEYESRVTRLKKTISAKRGYLKALQMDIQTYQKKNEAFISQFNDKLENHECLISKLIPTRMDVEEVNWSAEQGSIKVDIIE